MPLQVWDTTTGSWRSDIGVDLRDGVSKFVRILPIHIPSDDAGSETERQKNPIPKSLGSNFGDLQANGLDLRGVNPMPAGSTFTTTKTNGGDVTPISIDGSNCPYSAGGAYPSITRPIFYCFRIDPETSPNNKATGQLSISLKASGNHQDAMTVSVGVTDNG